MSVVPLDKPVAAASPSTDRPVTGSGMDRSVAVRSMPRRLKIALGAALILLLALGFWWFMPHGNSQTVTIRSQDAQANVKGATINLKRGGA